MMSAVTAGASPGATPVAAATGRRRSRAMVREAIWGYVFLSPWAITLVLFTLGPLLASLYLSFNDYDILGSPKWVGLANYVKAFTTDELVWPSIGRTVVYAVAIVPTALFGSLVLAILLNQRLVGTAFFRTLFFMPSLVPVVASAILWIWILHPKLGPVNWMIEQFGIQGPGWMSSAEWALPTVILIGLWGSLGGNRMIIFLAGLQGVPKELYEASDIDGARALDKFRHVTLPMISPTMLFNLILGVIGALQVFNIAFIATKGGPAFATWFFALHIYRQAFEYYRMGYGSALAWIFALGLLVFTYIQLRSSYRWVYYAGE